MKSTLYNELNMTTETDSKTIPTHVAIIPDGNRRWAKEHGLTGLEGHKKGYETAINVLEAAVVRGVKYLTFFAFSTENWSRTQDEVKYLMDLLTWVLKNKVDDFDKKGYRLQFFGSKEGLSEAHLKLIDQAVKKTAANTRATLNICFNYGARKDLVEAVQQLIVDGVKAEDVTEEVISSRLSSAGTPDPDLLIRTSGECRISNMLLWEAAYAELYFTDIYWPDFTEEEMDRALNEYARRQRRYGK